MHHNEELQKFRIHSWFHFHLNIQNIVQHTSNYL